MLRINLLKFLQKNNSKNTVTVIGSGGKTSVIRFLAKKIVSDLNQRVVITTTTKILHTEKFPFIIADNIQNIINNDNNILITGSAISSENKILPPNFEILRQIAMNIPFLLIEGDGSKGKSLKGYADYEPVIPEFSDIVITVIGGDILGKSFCEKNIHRFELVKHSFEKKENDLINTDDFLKIILKWYIPKLPKEKINLMVINKIREKNLSDFIRLKEKINAVTNCFTDILLNLYNENFPK